MDRRRAKNYKDMSHPSHIIFSYVFSKAHHKPISKGSLANKGERERKITLMRHSHSVRNWNKDPHSYSLSLSCCLCPLRMSLMPRLPWVGWWSFFTNTRQFTFSRQPLIKYFQSLMTNAVWADPPWISLLKYK